MAPVRLILVGGFLGAGKTTLIRQAGLRLAAQGLRVGIVTNDQAADLVDTEMLRREGFGVEEVSGGCFCCRFSDLLAASRKLSARYRPDVLLAEPVGSCTDLAATVLAPLRQFLPGGYTLAPLTVLVDPERLRELRAGRFKSPLSEKVLYLYGKQLEEADLLVLNKADRFPADERARLRRWLAERFPNARVSGLSALSGKGVEAWLEQVLEGPACAPRPVPVDYDLYAEGEAQLGWLNAAVRLRVASPRPWKPVCLDLLRALQRGFRKRAAEIAHVKLALTAPGDALVGNLTRSGGRPFLLVQGSGGESSSEACLLLNARVQTDPESLRATVEEGFAELERSGCTVEVVRLECFSPARPVPEHRATAQQDCPLDGTKVCGVIRDLFKPKSKSRA